MARRKRKYKRRNKKSALDYITLPNIELDADIKKGIIIVLLLLLGAVSFLSLFGSAGAAGVYLAKYMALVFGWGKWLFPLILLTLCFFLYNEDKYYIRGTNYFGLVLFVLTFQGLLHFFIDIGQWKSIISSGAGGGYIGMYMALSFNHILGFWGGLIILLGLLLISLMLMLDASLSSLVGAESFLAKIFYPIKVLFSKMFSRSVREVKTEDNEEEDEEFEDTEATEDEESLKVQNGTEDTEEEEYDDEDFEFSKKEVLAEPESIAQKDDDEDETKSIWHASNIKIDLPLSLLSSNIGKPTAGDIKVNSLIIQKTLENFGILVTMGDISVGPTVTQYTFKPSKGVKLARITTLNNDLALALAAHPIRIEAPIPGKSLVGVEVPNSSKAIVGLREILNTKDFKNRASNLMLAVGKDVSGKSWLYELGRMPHILVAGATGSGKSVCLNSFIVSLLYQNNPDDLRFIMVDPKRVELPVYNGIPHLLTPVITDVGKTINALKWCLNEMDRRFEILSKYGKRNILSYNQSISGSNRNGLVKMPYIVFIIDELADLMVAASRDIEAGVIRLAQMARAVGIHLVLATQRPSVDVITGLIKANMPARIAFSVASGVDSKTILDSLGAEKLLGQGDMLFITAEMSKPKRLQGAFVSDREIKKIVRFIKVKGGSADYIDGITDRQKVRGVAGVGLDGVSGDEDDLLEEAKEIVINMGKASASLLQRRLRIGYARAASIIDMLEEEGVVGPADGAKPRDILISKEQYAAQVSEGVSGVSLHSRDEAEEPENYLGEESDLTPDPSPTEGEGGLDDDEEFDEEDVEGEEVEEYEKDENKNTPLRQGYEGQAETRKHPGRDSHNGAGENTEDESENEDIEELDEDTEENDEDEDEGMFFSK